MQPILASGLLRTADGLAGAAAGSGRPALCDLRRATSTAYYALFQQLTRHGAFASMPDAEESDVDLVSRWFTHSGVRAASDLVLVAASRDIPRRPDASAVAILRRAPTQPLPAQLIVVAQAFGRLQDVREAADYSNAYLPNRYETLSHVATSQLAVRETWSMWRARSSPKPPRRQLHQTYRRFLQLALLKSGGPRTR